MCGVERGKGCAAGDVRDPRAEPDRARDVCDRAVGNAEEAKVAVFSHADAALRKPRSDRGAGAAGADDRDDVEHPLGSSPSRVPGTESVSLAEVLRPDPHGDVDRLDGAVHGEQQIVLNGLQIDGRP